MEYSENNYVTKKTEKSCKRVRYLEIQEVLSEKKCKRLIDKFEEPLQDEVDMGELDRYSRYYFSNKKLTKYVWERVKDSSAAAGKPPGEAGPHAGAGGHDPHLPGRRAQKAA